MRTYIIGNDGITLCREAPPAVNEGEIVVDSSEELHAAIPSSLPSNCTSVSGWYRPRSPRQAIEAPSSSTGIRFNAWGPARRDVAPPAALW